MKKNRLNILISNQTCIFTLYFTLNFYFNIKTDISGAYQITKGIKNEKIGEKISQYEFKYMTFEEFTVHCLNGKNIVSKISSDSDYGEQSKLYGFEIIYTTQINIFETDLNLIKDKRENFIKEKYLFVN